MGKTCCFTGHRPEKLGISEERAKALLKRAIEKAIEDGFDTFISGMARGIDMWAAEIVLEAGKTLICASPYSGFEARWSPLEQERYRKILELADEVRYVSAHYSRYCFQLRNVHMVDRSERVIAAYNGEAGGTRNTINYAKKKGVEVVNILI